MGVDQMHAARADEFFQALGVAAHCEGRFGGERQVDDFGPAALCGEGKRAGFGGDEGDVAGLSDGLADFNHHALGAASIEFWQHLQNRDGSINHGWGANTVLNARGD